MIIVTVIENASSCDETDDDLIFLPKNILQNQLKEAFQSITTNVEITAHKRTTNALKKVFDFLNAFQK